MDERSDLEAALAEARETILDKAASWGRTMATSTADAVRDEAYVAPEMVDPTVSQIAFNMIAGCRQVHDEMTAEGSHLASLFPEWLKALRDAFSAAANRETFDDEDDRSLYLKIVSKALAGMTIENMAD